MAFVKRILLFPLLGGIIFHLAGACLSGVLFIFLHYQNNFNANPELVLDSLQTLLMVGQLPTFLGVIVGVIAAFTNDWPNKAN